MTTLEFVDTNVFLRYLTNDIPEQADAVETLFKSAARGERLLVTTPLVVAEIVWTLQSYYHLPRERIKTAVVGILGTPGLDVDDDHIVLQAIIWYDEKNVDFIDAFHAAWLEVRGIKVAHTFDSRHFNRFEHLSVRVPGST